MADDRESKYTVSKEDAKKAELIKSRAERAAEEKKAAEKGVTVDKIIKDVKAEEEIKQLEDVGVVLDNGGAVDSSGDAISPIDQVVSLDADKGAIVAADGGIIGSKKRPGFVPGWLEQIQANQSKAGPPVTLSFNEQVKGWVSFKSYHKENGVTVNNQYYTFDNGSMWQHHINPIRNMFYGAAPTTEEHSYVTIIFNDAPSSVKNFQTVKYEGTRSHINKFEEVRVKDDDGGFVLYTDQEYYNLNAKAGWFVEYAETDLATGKVPEFIKKEGKYFNYIKGECTTLDNLDESEFQVQGIGFGSMTHSDPDSQAPQPTRVRVKDSSFDTDGTIWD